MSISGAFVQKIGSQVAAKASLGQTTKTSSRKYSVVKPSTGIPVHQATANALKNIEGSYNQKPILSNIIKSTPKELEIKTSSKSSKLSNTDNTTSVSPRSTITKKFQAFSQSIKNLDNSLDESFNNSIKTCLSGAQKAAELVRGQKIDTKGVENLDGISTKLQSSLTNILGLVIVSTIYTIISKEEEGDKSDVVKEDIKNLIGDLQDYSEDLENSIDQKMEELSDHVEQVKEDILNSTKYLDEEKNILLLQIDEDFASFKSELDIQKNEIKKFQEDIGKIDVDNFKKSLVSNTTRDLIVGAVSIAASLSPPTALMVGAAVNYLVDSSLNKHEVLDMYEKSFKYLEPEQQDLIIERKVVEVVLDGAISAFSGAITSSLSKNPLASLSGVVLTKMAENKAREGAAEIFAPTMSHQEIREYLKSDEIVSIKDNVHTLVHDELNVIMDKVENYMQNFRVHLEETKSLTFSTVKMKATAEKTSYFNFF